MPSVRRCWWVDGAATDADPLTYPTAVEFVFFLAKAGWVGVGGGQVLNGGVGSKLADGGGLFVHGLPLSYAPGMLDASTRGLL